MKYERKSGEPAKTPYDGKTQPRDEKIWRERGSGHLSWIQE